MELPHHKDPGNPVTRCCIAAWGDPWTLSNPGPSVLSFQPTRLGSSGEGESNLPKAKLLEAASKGLNWPIESEPTVSLTPITCWFGFSGGPRILLLIPFFDCWL